MNMPFQCMLVFYIQMLYRTLDCDLTVGYRGNLLNPCHSISYMMCCGDDDFREYFSAVETRLRFWDFHMEEGFPHVS